MPCAQVRSRGRGHAYGGIGSHLNVAGAPFGYGSVTGAFFRGGWYLASLHIPDRVAHHLLGGTGAFHPVDVPALVSAAVLVEKLLFSPVPFLDARLRACAGCGPAPAPEKPATLAAAIHTDRQPSFGIRGHRDPRTVSGAFSGKDRGGGLVAGRTHQHRIGFPVCASGVA